MSTLRQYLVGFVASRTRTFGGMGGSDKDPNPIAESLKDMPPMFAAGVDVGEVVDLVLQGIAAAGEENETSSMTQPKGKV